MTLKRVKTQKVDYSRKMIKPKFKTTTTTKKVPGVTVEGGGGGEGAIRLWRIVVLKVAYCATYSARNFAKSCKHYARIPKLCS